MRYVLEHEKVLVMLNDLNVMTPEAIRRKYKFTEAKVRYTLMYLLIMTTGKRPDAIANLKIEEIMAAKTAKNGLMVALCHNHKTFETYGAAHVVFYTEQLYLACVGYYGAFR